MFISPIESHGIVNSIYCTDGQAFKMASTRPASRELFVSLIILSVGNEIDRKILTILHVGKGAVSKITFSVCRKKVLNIKTKNELFFGFSSPSNLE